MFELSTKIQTYQSNAIGSCYISLFSKKKEKKEKRNCSINNMKCNIHISENAAL